MAAALFSGVLVCRDIASKCFILGGGILLEGDNIHKAAQFCMFLQMTSAYLSKSAPSWQFLGAEFTYQNPPCPLTQRGVIIFQIGDLSLGPMTLSKLDELEGSSPRSCSLPAMYLRKVYSI